MYKVKDVLTIKHEELKALREELVKNSLYPNVTEQNGDECVVLVCEIPKPQPWQTASAEIIRKKKILEKYKQDVEQVELFDMERTDYEEKKKAFPWLGKPFIL